MRFGEVKKLATAPQLLSVRTRIWTGFWLLQRPVMERSWETRHGGYKEWTNKNTQEKNSQQITTTIICQGYRWCPSPRGFSFIWSRGLTLFLQQEKTATKIENLHRRQSTRSVKAEKSFHVLSHEDMLTNILHNT